MPEAQAPPPSSAPAIEPRDYLRLVGLGALIGVPAGLVAAGFLALVHIVEDLLWTDLPDWLGHSSPPWYLVIGVPVVGALVVFAARTLLPGDGGHSPIGGLSVKPSPLAYGPGVLLAAVATLSFGAVLGPEAPLIALGSVVGVAVATLARVGERERMVLGLAGSFSAVSALFGGPLVAGMLLIEAGVGLGAALIPTLLPGLVAAACGYTLFIGLGNWEGIQTAGLELTGLPAYDGTSVGDLLLGVAVGLVTALLIAGVRVLAVRTDALRGRGVGMAPLLLAGGLAVGLLAWSADLLGADSQDVLFSGQAALPNLVAEGSLGVVVVLIVAKGLAYAISLGSGFRGGPVFPAVFLGIAVAMVAVELVDLSITAAVAIGTAAGMAAMTKLLFSSVLLAALLVGSPGFDALPAAVLAASTAWMVRMAIDRRSGDAVSPAAGPP